MDLPVALKYRQEYVNGCSCKQVEYNPTKIEAANKKAAAAPAAEAAQANAAAAPSAQPAGEAPQLDLDITGTAEPTTAEPAAEQPAPSGTEFTTEIAPPPPPPAATQAPDPGQSTITKKPRAAVN
jgi:hypothetical protein